MIETDRGGFPIQVDDLDADWLLALAEDAEIQARAAERRKLRYAAQWCVLNPAPDETDRATWADAGGDARGCTAPIGGDGTPGVAPFAAEQFAAALRVSTMAGQQLMADALNLQHRLPRHWARVEALDVAPWRARRVAQATASLSKEAAAHVDRQLADRVDSCGVVTIDRAVAEARAAFEPDTVADAERKGRKSWGVRLTHGAAAGDWAGTSWLEATGDTLDLTRFHDLVCATAERLREEGDEDDLEIRKAKALGIITDRATGMTTDRASDRASDRATTPAPARTRLYLHIGVDNLADAGALGRVERLGPATLARIRDWLAGSQATILPVLDLGRTDSVDRHDPPPWMRELVVLRDRHCVFPWCSVDARRCDLDHIEPYLDPDDGGPPDQTRPDNLAPLCRRHHRLKTFGRWRYQRAPDGSCTWRSPLGRSYAVTASGTFTLG